MLSSVGSCEFIVVIGETSKEAPLPMSVVVCKRPKKDDLHSSLSVAELAGVSPVGFLPSNVVSSVVGSRRSPWIRVYPKRPEAVRRSQGNQMDIQNERW